MAVRLALVPNQRAADGLDPGSQPGKGRVNDPTHVMATICARRDTAWSVLHGLAFAADPQDWVDQLGTRLRRLREATAWLDQEWSPNGMLLLDGLVRRAARRGGEDVAALAEDSSVAAQPGLGRLHRAVGTVSEMCAHELSCWQAGDEQAAKSLRVEQMALLLPGSSVRQEARALAAARLPVWSPVADLTGAYLLLETGR